MARRPHPQGRRGVCDRCGVAPDVCQCFTVADVGPRDHWVNWGPMGADPRGRCAASDVGGGRRLVACAPCSLAIVRARGPKPACNTPSGDSAVPRAALVGDCAPAPCLLAGPEGSTICSPRLPPIPRAPLWRGPLNWACSAACAGSSAGSPGAGVFSAGLAVAHPVGNLASNRAWAGRPPWTWMATGRLVVFWPMSRMSRVPVGMPAGCFMTAQSLGGRRLGKPAVEPWMLSVPAPL